LLQLEQLKFLIDEFLLHLGHVKKALGILLLVKSVRTLSASDSIFCCLLSRIPLNITNKKIQANIRIVSNICSKIKNINLIGRNAKSNISDIQ
jgi:hypothetical protein